MPNNKLKMNQDGCLRIILPTPLPCMIHFPGILLLFKFPFPGLLMRWSLFLMLIVI